MTYFLGEKMLSSKRKYKSCRDLRKRELVDNRQPAIVLSSKIAAKYLTEVSTQYVSFNLELKISIYTKLIYCSEEVQDRLLVGSGKC
jgi:hypothetical protein